MKEEGKHLQLHSHGALGPTGLSLLGVRRIPTTSSVHTQMVSLIQRGSWYYPVHTESQKN